MNDLRTRHVLFGMGTALLLGAVAAAALSGSLLDYNLNAPGSSAAGWLVAVLVLGLGLPLGIGWGALLGLRHWRPGYVAPAGLVLALAVAASWFGSGWLMHLLPDPTGLVAQVAAPAAGAWLGWRLARRPA